MKLSLSWIFDHIDGSLKKIDVPGLIKQLTTKTAEIEDVQHHVVELSDFTLAQVDSVDDSVKVTSPELNESIILSPREGIQPGQVFLLKKDKKGWRWADGVDFKSSKVGFLPQISVSPDQLKGSWKKTFEKEDYILSVDNVSLTHRPDLWGHRGFAREVAAILGLQLKPITELTTQVPVTNARTPEQDFDIKIEDKNGCRCLAGMTIGQIEAEGSWLWMLHRLLRVDSRPIDAIVDATNYVMLDISQPLHAFDASKLDKKQLVARSAKKGETLLLLDDQEIELSSGNLIISDGVKPRALAGIMGGKDSCVDADTHSLLIESASFDPKTIRHSSTQFKLRSEASARFEKNLDPNQNVTGLLRFIKIVDDNARVYTQPKSILSLGSEFVPQPIILTHEFIEKKLGIELPQAFIEKTLQSLDFGITVFKDNPLTYEITVPAFRGTKDVVIPEDIVEEIGRFYGLDKLPHKFPKLTMKPSNISPIINKDRIRNYLAFGASMHEVRNYALYDEVFLAKMDWQPTNTAHLRNPVSENMYRLVTSLVPNILKNIETNSTHAQLLNFFEMNAVWQKDGKKLSESQSLAGVLYDAKKPVDFYEAKELIKSLCAELSLEVKWRKAKGSLAQWYHPYQTAELILDDVVIGYAGLSNPGLLHRVVPGYAFIFELAAEPFITAQPSKHVYKPLAKYQTTWLDVSMMIPDSLEAGAVIGEILKADDRIYDVQYIDFFKKDEWKDQRSLTVRYFAQDEHKTLTSEDIEQLNAHVIERLAKLGAEIR